MEVTKQPTVTITAAPEPAEVGPVDNMRSSDNKSVVTDQFLVEEFFDFSNDDDEFALLGNGNGNEFRSSIKSESGASVTLLVDASCNSPVAELGNSNLTSELCVPYDDLAELEWVSAFTEDSFSISSEDMEKLQFISGMSARPDESASGIHDPNSTKYPAEVQVPGKARSKRARTAPRNWTSRLLLVSEPGQEDPKPKKVRKYGSDCLPVDGRRCLHCQTDKTPQWRTGPMGPKTLCNACGVRFKSGRLVPEYRPASSPTFIKTKHSNSHRKEMELRRQKEMMVSGTQHHHHQRYVEHYYDMGFDGSNGEEYLIHRRVGPDYGQLI